MGWVWGPIFWHTGGLWAWGENSPGFQWRLNWPNRHQTIQICREISIPPHSILDYLLSYREHTNLDTVWASEIWIPRFPLSYVHLIRDMINSQRILRQKQVWTKWLSVGKAMYIAMDGRGSTRKFLMSNLVFSYLILIKILSSIRLSLDICLLIKESRDVQ
jgi:hypothetical protein